MLEQGRSISPLAFVEKQRGALRIVAVDEIALSLGILPSMALADARARVPDLQLVEHDRWADIQLLEDVADLCERYTPSIEVCPPDGLTLDITGCTHLWENERDLLADLGTRLAIKGLTIRIALAETPDRAQAFARRGQHLMAINRQTPPKHLNDKQTSFAAEPPELHSLNNRDRLPASLPITALNLNEDQYSSLRRAGLYTIDDLASRPRAPLAARFGRHLVSKLARILGEEDVRIVPRRTLPALFTLHRFAEPASRTDYILAVLHDLTELASSKLHGRGVGGRVFTVSLYRSDGNIRRLTIETGRPTRDPEIIDRLLRERIDALSDPLDPGFGYDAVRLDVMTTEPLDSVQASFHDEAVDTAQVDGLIDRLSTRIGRQRIQHFTAGDSHIPEQAALMTPAASPSLVFCWPQPERDEPPSRPLHLFDPPQRVEVIAEVPDGPPRRFRWRRVTHDVIAHEGPERIASEWWRRREGFQTGKGGLTRDYYRVEDSKGRRFWLFRHGLYGAEEASPGWYLHGAFA